MVRLVVCLVLALCLAAATVIGQPASDVFQVTGSLSGSDFVVDYSFQATATLQLASTAGTPDSAYLVSSVLGTRTFTNTTTNATSVASLTLVPLGTVGFNNNTLYPNSPSPFDNHTILDWDGFAFSLSEQVEVAGYDNVTFSTVNLFWDSTALNPQYAEEGAGTQLEVGITAASFTALVLTSAASSSSSTGSSTVPSGSSSSSPTVPVSVLGDPQFVGLRGQAYQVHGMDGAVYSLIVDRDTTSQTGSGLLLVNARFRFLSSGRCPLIPSPTNCWSHPGSYLGELGVLSGTGDRLHVASGPWHAGFSLVELNDQPLSIGSSAVLDGLTVQLPSAYRLQLTVGNFMLTIDNSDGFVNLAQLQVRQWSQLSSHGLLGQTWRTSSHSKASHSQLDVIQGDVDDYVEKSGDLFGSDFMYGVEETAEAVNRAD